MQYDADSMKIIIPAVELYLVQNPDGSYTSAYMDKNAELKRAIQSTVVRWASSEAKALASTIAVPRQSRVSRDAELMERMETTQRLLAQLLAKVGMTE